MRKKMMISKEDNLDIEINKEHSKTNTVTIIDPNTQKKVSYFLEGWIRDRFDKKIIPDLKKKDKDCVIAIDGAEGSGKSTLGLQWCKYVDPSFNLERVVFTPEEFREAVYKAEKGQAIMFDEAFTGFSSRAALSGVNKTLISMMMQVRQKNLFIVIVLPTVFLLDKYISIFRTKVLVHVYQNKNIRGYFRVYSSKKKRQLIMHKDARVYSYGIWTNKKGRFYGKFALGDDEEDKYRDKKMKALESSKNNPMTGNEVRYREQRNIMLHILRKELKLPYRQMAKLLDTYEFNMSYRQIATICAKYGNITKKEDEIEDNE
jgi:hypothetical protein